MIRCKNVITILLQQLLIKQIGTVTIDFATQFIPQQTNDLITQYPTAQYTGKVQRCRRTIKNCRCLDVWDYQGSTYQACANPDSDEQGNWCQIQDGCVNEDLTGLLLLQNNSIVRYDYCPSFCLDLPYSRKTQEQGVPQGCGVTNKGCTCLEKWSYESEQNITGCSNPDNDSQGPWCIVDSTTCAPNTFTGELIYHPSGQILNFDYCPPVCEEQQEKAKPSIIIQPITPVSEIPTKIRAEDEFAVPDVEDTSLNFLNSEDLQQVINIQSQMSTVQSQPLMEDLNDDFVSIDLDLDEGILQFQNQTFFGMQVIAEPSTEILQLNLLDVNMLRQIIGQDDFNDTAVTSKNVEDILLQVDNLEKYEIVLAPRSDTGFDEINSKESSIPQKTDDQSSDVPISEIELDALDVADIDARSPIPPLGNSEAFSPSPEVDVFPLDQYEIIHEVNNRTAEQANKSFSPLFLFQPPEGIFPDGTSTLLEGQQTKLESTFNLDNFVPEVDIVPSEFQELFPSYFKIELVLNNPSEELGMLPAPENENKPESKGNIILENEEFPLDLYEIIYEVDDTVDADNTADTTLKELFLPPPVEDVPQEPAAEELPPPVEDIPLEPAAEESENQPTPEIEQESIYDLENIVPDIDEFALDQYEIIHQVSQITNLSAVSSSNATTTSPISEEMFPYKEISSTDISPQVEQFPLDLYEGIYISKDNDLEEQIQSQPTTVKESSDIPNKYTDGIYPQQEDEFVIPGLESIFLDQELIIQGQKYMIPEVEDFPLDKYEIIFASRDDIPMPVDYDASYRHLNYPEYDFRDFAAPHPQFQQVLFADDLSQLDEIQQTVEQEANLPYVESQPLDKQQIAYNVMFASDTVLVKLEDESSAVGPTQEPNLKTSMIRKDPFPNLYSPKYSLLQSELETDQVEQILIQPPLLEDNIDIPDEIYLLRENEFGLPEVESTFLDKESTIQGLKQMIPEVEDFPLDKYEIIFASRDDITTPVDWDASYQNLNYSKYDFNDFPIPRSEFQQVPFTDDFSQLDEIHQIYEVDAELPYVESQTLDTRQDFYYIEPNSDIDVGEVEDEVFAVVPNQKPKSQVKSPAHIDLSGKDPFPNLYSPKNLLQWSELDTDQEEKIQILPPSLEEDIDILDEIPLLHKDEFVIPDEEREFLDEENTIQELEYMFPEAEDFPLDKYVINFASEGDITTPVDQDASLELNYLEAPTQEPIQQIGSTNNTSLFVKDPFPNLYSPKNSLMWYELDIDEEHRLTPVPEPNFESPFPTLYVPKGQGQDTELEYEIEVLKNDTFPVLYTQKSQQYETEPILEIEDQPRIEGTTRGRFVTPYTLQSRENTTNAIQDVEVIPGIEVLSKENFPMLYAPKAIASRIEELYQDLDEAIDLFDQAPIDEVTAEVTSEFPALKSVTIPTINFDEVSPPLFEDSRLSLNTYQMDQEISDDYVYDAFTNSTITGEGPFEESSNLQIDRKPKELEPKVPLVKEQKIILAPNTEQDEDDTNKVPQLPFLSKNNLSSKEKNKDAHQLVQQASPPLSNLSIALQYQSPPIPSPPPNIEEKNEDSLPPLLEGTQSGKQVNKQDFILLASPPPPASPFTLKQQLTNEETAPPFPSPQPIFVEDDVNEIGLIPNKQETGDSQEFDFSPPPPNTQLLQTLESSDVISSLPPSQPSFQSVPPPPSPTLSLIPTPAPVLSLSAVLPSPSPSLLESPPLSPTKIIRQRYYKQGIPAEFVEQGSICNVSRAGCDCLPFWNYDADGDGRESLFRGCVQTKDARGRAWCPIDPDTCRGLPASEGTSTKERTATPWDFCPNRCTLTRRGGIYMSPKPADNKHRAVKINIQPEAGMLVFTANNYSAETDISRFGTPGKCSTTLNGCQCRLRWSYEGLMQKGCTRPDGTSAFSWCVVRENCKNAIGFIANSVDGWEWDICDETC